jgi:hypothetical protein
VLAAHRLVSESEAALNVMLASIEKTRAREVQPFLDSLPTMAAATARAYDTSLRSVQLLAKLALAIDNASPASQVREANSLHENMLSVTTLWIQTRQALVDDGKNMRESVSMPLTTQLAEMSRTTASAHRAMAVYGRLMLDKVELLEKAANGQARQERATCRAPPTDWSARPSLWRVDTRKSRSRCTGDSARRWRRC